MKRRQLILSTSLWSSGFLPTLAPKAALATSGPVIRFGQSASLSGSQATYGKEVREGIQAAFLSASQNSGIRFELASLDDGGDKERCKQNTQGLIDAGVSGLVGYTSGAAAEAALKLVEDAQIAMLGTASGNMGIRNNKLTTQFHIRAGYDTEFRRLVSYIKDFGMRRIGYVHLKDTSSANLQAMTSALDTVGVKLTTSVALDRNAKSFTNEAEQLLAAKLDCVMFTTNAGPITSVVEQMAAGRYPGLYFSSSFAGQSLIDAMAQRGHSVIMSQVMPRPNALGLNVVNRCKQDLAALGAGTRLGFTSLEGYVTGLVAVEAARQSLKKNGGSLSAMRFKESLLTLRADFGGYKVDFSSGSAQGSQFVDVVAIDRQGRIIG